MTGQEIRTRFLEHFTSRDHIELASAPLVPDRDPTTLFISAGMHPLKPYYQGVSRPPAPRLTTAQKCFRTGDLEEVGRTDRHCTFFEMLGNFAPTGDYFKETAIPLAWELVTEGFGLPSERLRVTIHPTDDDAFAIWTGSVGLPEDWVHRNPENWWSAGETGPCGPDSEIWWDRGPEVGCGRPDCHPDHCERYLEFWNLVFMEFDRQADGSMPPLPRPGIDTGMGLERMSAILQGVPNIFETDLYRPLVDWVRQGSREHRVNSERLIADHLRGMTFVIGDGVLPGNEGRGYVLRRLVRRALLHARGVGLDRPLAEGVDVVVATMADRYPELGERAALVRETVAAEAERFGRTLEQGMELFERLAARHGDTIPGDEAFKLHDTFGFPLELTRELAAERGLAVSEESFRTAMSEQRARSRSMTGQRWPDVAGLPRTEFTGYTAVAGTARILLIRRDGVEVDRASEGDEVEVFLDRSPFYAEAGGQVGDTGAITSAGGGVRVEDTQRPAEGVIAHLGRVEIGTVVAGEEVQAAVDAERRRQVSRHHSATHLLHRALGEVLGIEGGLQKGSWVGPDHTTFDFPLGRALTRDELEQVQVRVAGKVREALPFSERFLALAEAIELGAMHLFEEKYGDVVRVVGFGGWTSELCGGIHVANTADIGTVVVLSESSIGTGLRRIDLTVGETADALVRRRMAQVGELSRSLGVPVDRLQERVEELRRSQREAERRAERLQDELRSARVHGAGEGPRRRPARVPLLLEEVEAEGPDDLRGWADRFLESLGGSGVVVVTAGGGFVVKVSRDLVEEVDGRGLVELLGRGGGRPELVQGRLGRPPAEAFAKIEEALR